MQEKCAKIWNDRYIFCCFHTFLFLNDLDINVNTLSFKWVIMERACKCKLAIRMWINVHFHMQFIFCNMQFVTTLLIGKEKGGNLHGDSLFSNLTFEWLEQYLVFSCTVVELPPSYTLRILSKCWTHEAMIYSPGASLQCSVSLPSFTTLQWFTVIKDKSTSLLELWWLASAR